MIKEIKKLKNCGIFQDLQKLDRLPFNEKNIIYGWNYSGKTTISRLFNFLNKDVILPDEYKDIEFEVTLDNGTSITNVNRSTSPLLVKVFNSDFISENISFNSSIKKTKGIAFDVGADSIEKRKSIEINLARIEKAKTLIQKYESKKTQFDDFESSKFTKAAKFIKNDILNSVIEFNKGHLKSVLTSIKGNLDKYILSEKDATSEKILLSQNLPKEKLPYLILFLHIIIYQSK